MTTRIAAIHPAWALPGARVTITGPHLPLPAEGFPHVSIGGVDARVVGASANAIRVVVPAPTERGRLTVRIDELPGEITSLQVGRALTTGLHQVDSPAFDAQGRLYVTHSGARDSKSPIPLFRVDENGVRHGRLVEFDETSRIFTNPTDKRTEDYITGRFG